MGLFDMIDRDGRRMPIAPPLPSGPTREQLAAEQAALGEVARLKADRAYVPLPPDEVGTLDAYTHYLPGMTVDRPTGLVVADDGETLLTPPMLLSDLIDSPEQAVYGAAPGYGPAATAEQLETAFGRLEDEPGWFNAKQFANASAQYAKERGGTDAARRESQFLMSPERYEYMQEGPGRAVDLLDQLRDDPKTALHFWNKSKGARATRDDYGDPLMQGAGANYGRYQGAGRGAIELLSSPLSPIGRYVNTQGIVPAALAHDTRNIGVLDSLGIAYANDLAKQRYRTGENPILDIEDRLPGEKYGERAARWASRNEAVQSDLNAMAPPDADELARNKFGANAPPVLGRALETAYGFLDATAPVSVVAALRSVPGSWMAREAARAVSRSAGVPMSAARSMLSRASSAMPGSGVLSQGAKVATYRGVPASAYAAELRRPTLANWLPGAAGGFAKDETLPEVGLEATVSAALPQPERTWGQFAASPAMDMPEDEYQKLVADRAAAAEAAAVRTENLVRQQPNEIWNEFQKAHAANAPQGWLTPERYRQLNEAANARRRAPDAQ